MKKILTFSLLLLAAYPLIAAENPTRVKAAGFQLQHFPQKEQHVQSPGGVAATTKPSQVFGVSNAVPHFSFVPNPYAVPPASERNHWGGAIFGTVLGALLGVVIAEITVKPDDGYLDFTGLTKAIIIGGCGIAGGVTLGIIGFPIKGKGARSSDN